MQWRRCVCVCVRVSVPVCLCVCLCAFAFVFAPKRQAEPTENHEEASLTPRGTPSPRLRQEAGARLCRVGLLPPHRLHGRHAVAKAGEKHSKLGKLVRGMPDRLMKCKKNKFGPIDK